MDRILWKHPSSWRTEWGIRIAGDRFVLVAETEIFEGGDGGHVECYFVELRTIVAGHVVFDAEAAWCVKGRFIGYTRKRQNLWKDLYVLWHRI